MQFLTHRLDSFLEETRNADNFFESNTDSFGDNYKDKISKITNSVGSVLDEIKVNIRTYPTAFNERKKHISQTTKDVISRIDELHAELKTPGKYDLWWLGHLDKHGRKSDISPYHALDKHFDQLKKNVVKRRGELLRQLNDEPSIAYLDNKEYTKKNWFFIGLKFANGEMDKLLERSNNNYTQVAKKLGNETGYRPYISATAEKNKGDKNIYGSINKMEKIKSYCVENNIETTPYFNAAIKRIQSR